MKKYQIIYADPPWNYKVYSKKGLGRSAESHYPTMSIEDICALPVGNLADKDCALFLWVTIPCLLEGLSVLKAWGFTYKTVGFVWVKQNRKADSLFWAIYAVLVQNIALEDDIIMAIWSCVGYTVLLCFTLFKTGSLAKSVFQAH